MPCKTIPPFTVKVFVMINMRFTPLLTKISQKHRKIGWGGEIEERGRKNTGQKEERGEEETLVGLERGGGKGVGESE